MVGAGNAEEQICRTTTGTMALALLVMAWALSLALPPSAPAYAEGPRADTTPPAPVAGLAAVDAHDGKVNLSWNASADADFARYAIYRDSIPFLSLGNRTPGATLEDINATHFTAANLTNGVQYFFAVTAIDTSGNEDRTVVSVSATPTASVVVDTTPPPAVTGLAATDAHDGRVNLTWTPVDVLDFARYEVYVATLKGAPVSGLAPALNLTGMSTVRATLSGLKDNTTYYFAITAVDLSGNENRTVLATVAATPTPTPVPPATPGKPSEPAKADLTPYYAVTIVTLAAIATYLALDAAEGTRRPGSARNETETDVSEGDDDE